MWYIKLWWINRNLLYVRTYECQFLHMYPTCEIHTAVLEIQGSYMCTYTSAKYTQTKTSYDSRSTFFITWYAQMERGMLVIIPQDQST